MTQYLNTFTYGYRINDENSSGLSFLGFEETGEINYFSDLFNREPIRNKFGGYPLMEGFLENNESSTEQTDELSTLLKLYEEREAVKQKNIAQKTQMTADTDFAENYSQTAVTEFSAQIAKKKLTIDEINELYLRCSREISNKAPKAWAALDAAYSNSLSGARTPNTSMDANSRNAIQSFKGSINSGMTSDEMNETFLRFIREVSTKYPDAWKEMESVLSSYITNSRKPDTSMDDQSRNAITNFKQTINSGMTKDEMIETFLRFSREVSVNFPEAWKELDGILDNNLSRAFTPDNTSDASSEQAVTNFKTTISSEMTKDDLTELFLRFSRDISNKYPEKKNELLSIFNNSLPEAFKPDTTIDKDSLQLIDDFKTIITTQSMDKDRFEDVFSDYFKQIGLNLSKARTMMMELKSNKSQDADNVTFFKNEEVQDSQKIKSEFDKLVLSVDKLNLNIQSASSTLGGIYNEDEQQEVRAEINQLMGQKYQHDSTYSSLMTNITGNNDASNLIKDDYLFNLSVQFAAPDKKQIVERNSEGLTEWDMLRTMRRDELKDLIYQIPTEELAEILYAVPKTTLLNGLEMLPHEQQLEVLKSSRFEESLVRDMPRKQLIDQLPDAYEMLPVLMTFGSMENGFRTGVDLIEDTVLNGNKVAEPQNDTRQMEALLPFMMEQLLEKTPRMADATRPVTGQKSLMKAQMDKFNNQNINNSQPNHQLLTQVSMLNQAQLGELATEALNSMTEGDMNSASAADRGGSEEWLNFLKDLRKVDGVDAGKMAMSNLYNSQAQKLKAQVLPALSDRELLKINLFYGKDPKDMVRELPSHVVLKQLHEMSKEQIVEGYKKIDKSMIMNRIQDLPSQVITGVAANILPRDTVYANYANGQGVAA